MGEQGGRRDRARLLAPRAGGLLLGGHRAAGVSPLRLLGRCLRSEAHPVVGTVGLGLRTSAEAVGSGRQFEHLCVLRSLRRRGDSYLPPKGGKRPLRLSSPNVNLTLPSPPLNPVPKHHIYTSFKYPSDIVESDEVSPQPPFLQAEQPQLPQPLPISLVLQTLPQLRCPSLDTLQPLNVSLVVGGPTLNTAFEVQPYQCRVQGHDHFSSPAGHTVSDTSQDAIGRLGHLGTQPALTLRAITGSKSSGPRGPISPLQALERGSTSNGVPGNPEPRHGAAPGPRAPLLLRDEVSLQCWAVRGDAEGKEETAVPGIWFGGTSEVCVGELMVDPGELLLSPSQKVFLTQPPTWLIPGDLAKLSAGGQLGSRGQADADPAAESYSNRQERDGAHRGFARGIFACHGS
ncbi:hypothetical protein QYF61_017428 [Mycteria americana]|uniref:Uncharacterized protein n=1 Tax=Mycteria americana TaxID=33587 RepID=A0AAN7MRY3_MYCAM|nr:hypothetical protein QYF61_017428 [Mycteria americana]